MSSLVEYASVAHLDQCAAYRTNTQPEKQRKVGGLDYKLQETRMDGE